MEERITYCGNVSAEFIEKEIVLKGWVQKRRDLGGVIFIDLHNHGGIIQVVFDPEKSKETWEIANKYHGEYVIEVKGQVVYCDKGAINSKMGTGEFEVVTTGIAILDTAETTPFTIGDGNNVNDELRIEYRYLDSCRLSVTDNIKLRHQVAKTIRHYLDNHDLLDIETPHLGRPTLEGVRDYLVPSRTHAGHFYALPQSPQLPK